MLRLILLILLALWLIGFLSSYTIGGLLHLLLVVALVVLILDLVQGRRRPPL